MFRKRKVVSRFALGIIAVENIVKPICGCLWHTLGRPDLCAQLDQHFEDEFSERQMRDHWMDDYPDFDEGFDDSCRCYNCRHGHPELCVTKDDDLGTIEEMDKLWDEIDCTFIDDGSVRFDDVRVPGVRQNKRTRTQRRDETQHEVDAWFRSSLSRAREMSKIHFMVLRRNRERIGQILSREEMNELELEAESDDLYWAAWFPEEHFWLSCQERAELLQRNFPGLSKSSVGCIATSWHIQESSSFKGLEGMQKFEQHVAEKNEEYFSELDGYFPDEGSLSTAHALVDSFNQCALLAFRG